MPKEIVFYIHEKQKEPFMRLLLQLEILHQRHMGYRERVELFFDLYGNALITQRSQKFLDEFVPHLLDLLAED